VLLEEDIQCTRNAGTTGSVLERGERYNISIERERVAEREALCDTV